MLNIRSFRIAYESLMREKGYVTTIVLTLGITLGALVTTFNLNYQLLIASLPYPNAERLALVKSQRFDNGILVNDKHAPYPALIAAYRQKSELFEYKALIAYTDSVEKSLPDSPILRTLATTPEIFSMLNVPLALGRSFNADEGLDARSPVAVISYKTWQRIFQKDPNALGKSLHILDVEFKIIGVLAEDFIEPELEQPGMQTDVWLPFDFNDSPAGTRQDWNGSLGSTYLVGKVSENTSVSDAAYEINRLIASYFEHVTTKGFDTASAAITFNLLPFRDLILRNASHQSLLTFLGVLTLLLIASTNILNLMVARAANRKRTMAIQVALGAQKAHIFSAIFCESLLLLLCAGMVSVFVSVSFLDLLKAAAQDHMPRLRELQLNLPTLVFAIGTSAFLAIVFSLLIIRQVSYRSLNSDLQTSGKGVEAQVSHKLRRLLILVQVSLTGILLSLGIHILSQSLGELIHPMGYNTENQFQVRLNIASLTDEVSSQSLRNYLLGMADDLRKQPQINAVGLTSASPISYGGTSSQFIYVDDVKNKLSVSPNFCDGSYLNIIGMPLVDGRYYTDAEAKDGAGVAVVNETLARKIQSDGKVLGLHVHRQTDINSQPIVIVGVVKDLHLPGRDEPARLFLASIPEGEMLVQVKQGYELGAAEINRLAAKYHSQLKVFDLHSTAQHIGRFTSYQKTAAAITTALVLLALGLTAIGIYGVLSYSVALRRFELGVRMALGARSTKVFMQMLWENLLSVFIGLFISLGAVAAIFQWIQSSQFGLQSHLLGWLLPPVLIFALTAAASLASVWRLVHTPASDLLRGD